MTSVYVHDLPTGLASGSGGIRRVLVIITGTVVNASQADTLTDYVKNISSIESEVFRTLNNAVASTANTWSSAVITYAMSDATSRSAQVGLICKMT